MIEGLNDKLLLLPLLLPILIVSASLHELAHGLVAHRLGDKTARDAGRLTLNPLRHLDAWGSAMFLVTFLFASFAFGWARPVPVAPWNFRSPKTGMALVAVAGPVSNFFIAFVVWIVAWPYMHGESLSADPYLAQVIWLTMQINVALSLFNLFPLPPLDGSRIVGAFMPDEVYEQWSKLDQFAPLILLALFLFAAAPVTQLMFAGFGYVLALFETVGLAIYG